jgi:hypothetical protein
MVRRPVGLNEDDRSRAEMESGHDPPVMDAAFPTAAGHLGTLFRGATGFGTQGLTSAQAEASFPSHPLLTSTEG